MGMSAGGGGKGPMAEINVTPLVDVMLVLIIIFMLITPVLTSGIDVRLPQAESVDEGQDVG
jgi:biopolymer transport protein ExbD